MDAIKNEERPDLMQLFRDGNFSNDPAAIDSIIEHYELINEEDDDFMLELQGKLPLMTPDWQCPWYQRMEGSITRTIVPDPTQPDQYLTGRFTQDEDNLLWSNWEQFQKDFRIPNKPQSFARWKNKEKNKSATNKLEMVRGTVTAHLARGLQRTLHQVYHHFVVEFAYPVKGYYSLYEERIMEMCFENYRSVKAVRILSKVLGREPRGMYKRYEIFLNGKKESKRVAKWTLEFAKTFVDSLMRHSSVDLESLRDKIIEKDIWLKVQEDMDVPYDHLKKMWFRKLHVQFFSEKSITTKHIRKGLYKFLKRGKYKRWRDIRWKEVCARFPVGFTPQFLHYHASRFVLEYCRDYLRRPLSDVLHVWGVQISQRYRNNRRLKLLRFDSKGNLYFKKHPSPSS